MESLNVFLGIASVSLLIIAITILLLAGVIFLFLFKARKAFSKARFHYAVWRKLIKRFI